MTVGSLTSSERPPDRADVVLFYQVSSPAYVLNLTIERLIRFARLAAMGRYLKCVLIVVLAYLPLLAAAEPTRGSQEPKPRKKNTGETHKSSNCVWD
jgi:hypothetical protein